MDKLKLRWAVTVTIYRKAGYKSYDNSLLQSIVMADTDDEAITKSVQSEMVTKQEMLILIHNEIYITEGNNHQRSYKEALYHIMNLIKDHHQSDDQKISTIENERIATMEKQIANLTEVVLRLSNATRKALERISTKP